MLELIKLELKKNKRSVNWHANLLLQIFTVLSALYLLVNLLLVGFLLDDILMAIFKHQNPVYKVNGFLAYYFIVDLISKYYVQKVPILGLQPYLTLPIRKSKLIHFMMLKGVLNVGNFMLLIFLIPFAFQIIYTYESAVGAFTWLLALLSLSVANTYLNIYLKRISLQKPFMFIPVVGGLAALLIADYFDFLPIQQISSAVFNPFVYQPIAVVLALALAFAAYWLNFRWLISKSYLNLVQAFIPASQLAGNSLQALNRFGILGQNIGVELKLIWRNKRPKSVVLLSFVFVLYGLIFYTQEDLNIPIMTAIVGLIITGMFLFNYGQYLYSWESSHMEMLMTAPLNTISYLSAKYWMFLIGCGVSFLLSLGYMYFDYWIGFYNLCLFLFNAGFNVFVVMWLTAFSPKPVDLKQSTVFNYQGMSTTQWILMLPVFGIPLLIISLFSIFDQVKYGFALLGILGAIGILTSSVWLSLISKFFVGRKHLILENFRAK